MTEPNKIYRKNNRLKQQRQMQKSTKEGGGCGKEGGGGNRTEPQIPKLGTSGTFSYTLN